MKIIKKIFVLLLVLLSMLVLSASCGETEPEYEDATDIYLDAKEKTDSLNAFCAQLTTRHTFNGHEYVSEMSSVTKVNYDNSDALCISNSYNTTVSLNDGTNVTKDSSLYYKDLVIYQKNSDSEKYMSVMDESGEESMANSYSGVSLDLPSEIFKNSTVTKDKSTIVKTEPKVDDVKDILSTFVGEMGVYYAPLNEEFDYKYSDVEIRLVINNDGYFSEMSIGFTVSFETSQGDKSVGIAVDVVYSDFDGDITIEEPSDLLEYTYYLGEEEKTQEQLEEEYMNEVLALYDQDNNKVEDFNTHYVELCMKYGRAAVDSIVDAFEMAKAMQ